MLKEQLDEYIRNTGLIRTLSYPDPSKLSSGAEYGRVLRENFIRIGEIASRNRSILSDVLEPVFLSDQSPDAETIEILNSFSESLLDASSVESLDIPLSYMISVRLMEYAMKGDDTSLKIRQADFVISSSYSMINLAKRFGFGADACAPYRETGFRAARYIRQFCNKEALLSLDEQLRETVIVDSRFSTCLYEGSQEDPACCQDNIDILKWSFDLGDDPQIRALVPGYDWRYHRFRIMEYITAVSEHNNSRGCTFEQRLYISDVCDQLLDIWDSDPDYYDDLSPRIYVSLMALRSRYLSGRIDRTCYLKRLTELYDECEEKKDSFHAAEEVHYIIGIPLEYIYALERPSGFVSQEADHVTRSGAYEPLTQEQISALTRFYHVIEEKVLYTIDTRSMSYLLEFLSMLIMHFIEIPQVSFKSFCLSAMRALHPPTYVHSCMVSEISRCICHCLIEHDPGQLAGTCALMSPQDIREHEDDILSLISQAALCHDFGKIPQIDIIFVYGRSLFDFEFSLIRQHPDLGVKMLERIDSLRNYSDIVRGHHRWFDDSGGYPESFHVSSSSFKALIDIVACADCMDAATDTVGRSYSRGKTLDEYIAEVEEGAGTRYAPYLPDLLKLPDVHERLEKILKERREEFYRLTYKMLIEKRQG